MVIVWVKRVLGGEKKAAEVFFVCFYKFSLWCRGLVCLNTRGSFVSTSLLSILLLFKREKESFVFCQGHFVVTWGLCIYNVNFNTSLFLVCCTKMEPLSLRTP